MSKGRREGYIINSRGDENSIEVAWVQEEMFALKR